MVRVVATNMATLNYKPLIHLACIGAMLHNIYHMETIPYWDDETLLIYGILSGFISLNPREVAESLNQAVNQEGSILTSIHIVAGLENKQKIKTNSVWLNLRKYLRQLQKAVDPETDELDGVIERVRKIADSEVDDREVLRANFSELLQQKDILTELLHGCLEVQIKVLDKSWIRQLVRDYLEYYRNDKLFTPTAPTYIPYEEQYVAVTNFLEDSKYPAKITRFHVPDNVRFFESLYDLVDKEKIVLTEMSNPNNSVNDPRFGLIVGSDKKNSLRPADRRYINVEAKNYDPASGILTVVGQPIKIIKQPNKLGKTKESKQAKLMRKLFYQYTFPQGEALRGIYPHKGESYPQHVVKKARELVAAINRKVDAKIGVPDLIISDDWKFEINPDYLKD